MRSGGLLAGRGGRNPIAHRRIVGLDLHDRLDQRQRLAFQVKAPDHQPVAGGLEIEDRLRAVDLHQRLALVKTVALGDVPLDDRGLDLGRALGRQIQRHLEQTACIPSYHASPDHLIDDSPRCGRLLGR